MRYSNNMRLKYKGWKASFKGILMLLTSQIYTLNSKKKKQNLKMRKIKRQIY